MRKHAAKSIFFSLFVFSFLCARLVAQKPNQELNWQGFSEFVAKTMEEWRVPGLGIAVIKEGKVVFSEGFGLRDINRGLKVTRQSLFPIASCTKTFTAVSLAILVDEGKVGWDIPIREYFPSFRLYDAFASDHITLRDLLAHRSGLPQHYRMYFNRNITRKEIMERLRFLEPSEDFRERFQYANINYTIAAYILEQMTQVDWEEFVQRKVFNPLEMINSNFSVVDSQKTSDYSLPYREEDGEIKEIPFFDVNLMGMGPAGSINSNAIDIANWLLFQLNKGKYKGRQVISEACLSETQKPQIVMPGGMSGEIFYWSYGMGWAITSYRGHLMLGHGGGFDGFGCYISILPRDNIGCAVLCNLEGSPVTQILTRTVYDRLLGLSEIPWNQRMKESLSKSKANLQEKEDLLNPETKLFRPLEDYCGEFGHSAYGVLTVKIERDQLSVIHSGLTSPLAHLFYDVFETRDKAFGKYRFSFISDNTGAVNSIGVPFEPFVKNIVFRRKTTIKEERK